MPLKENEAAIYGARVNLAQKDLDGSRVYLCFATIDDHGWIYVNDRLVGESHYYQTESAFDIKEHLHAGDNLIAVRVKNDGGPGGMDPLVNVLVSEEEMAPWSRSLFNGLAQVIVRSDSEAGEFKLTATAEGLAPATSVVKTQPSKLSLGVP